VKRLGIALLMAAVLAMCAALPAAADSGMEGIWIGSDSQGDITLMLGAGSTFISVYESDRIYQQAGLYSTDQETLYLWMSDGSNSTLRYGFSDGYLYLSVAEGSEEVQMRRADPYMPEGLPGVWAVGESGGLIGMDAAGNFFSADVETGQVDVGIYLIYGEDMLMSFQDGSSMRMGFRMGDGWLEFENPDTGEVMELERVWLSA